MVKNVNNTSMGREKHPDMLSEIQYQKTNRISLNKLSDWFLLEGQSILGMPILKRYEHILKADLVDYSLSSEYHYKPEYLSNELYETTDLWYLLLFVNDMATIDEFNKPVIKVFDTNTINALNRILNSDDNISVYEDPKDIKKHYMKNLNEKSDEVLPEYMKERYIPFRKYDKFIDELDLIINDKYFRERYKVYEDRFYSDDGSLSIPFRLNEEGLSNMSSIYYRDGYTLKSKGKMRFTPGEEYAIMPLYSGELELKITDDDGNTIYNDKTMNEIKDPILNIDLRKANDEDVEHINVIETDVSSVTFNPETGRYKMSSKRLETEEDTEFPFAKITLNSEDENTQLDVDRIAAETFFIFNIKYKTEFIDDNNPNARLSFDIIYHKRNGRTETYTDMTSERKDIYNTRGLTSYLKHSQYNTSDIEKMEIIFYARDITSSESFEFTLEEVDISGSVEEDIKKTFIPTKLDWHNIEITYRYGVEDNEGFNVFSHPSKEGIFFQPEIVAKRPYGLFRLKSQLYTGFYNREIKQQNMGKYGYINFDEGRRLYDENSLNYTWSRNFTFPDSYILTVRMINEQKSGGAGIIFDYQPDTQEGYMLWNPGPLSNWGVPYFNRDPEPYNIMHPGFHEIDKTFGKFTPIFTQETDKALHITNSEEFETEELFIKIIKDFNRIRIFTAVHPVVFDYTNPVVDIRDIENIKVNGRLGFVSAFSGLEVEFIEYYRIKDLNEI